MPDEIETITVDEATADYYIASAAAPSRPRRTTILCAS